MATLNYYFEFSSPYSAISTLKLFSDYQNGNLNNIKLSLHCINLGQVFQSQGESKGPILNNPSKSKYIYFDFQRESKRVNGITLKIPKKFPLNSVNACRITNLLIKEGYDNFKILNFMVQIYLLGFQKHEDISNLNSLKEILITIFNENQVEDILKKIETKKVKDLVKENTNFAIKNGIFGAPSFIINNQLFWGQDRYSQAIETAKNLKVKL